MPNMRSPKSPSPMPTENRTIGVGVLMRHATTAPIKSAGRAARLRCLCTVYDPLTIAKLCLLKPGYFADLVSSLATADDSCFVLHYPDELSTSV